MTLQSWKVHPCKPLSARFLKDPSPENPPEAVAIQQPPEFYSAEYTFAELLADPRTDALVKKYLTLPKFPFIRAITVEQLMSFSNGNIGDIYGFLRELKTIPVNPDSDHQ